jgi:hypothetical protein
MIQDPELKRIINRHIGRLLTDLDEIGISEIAKQAIKRKMWESAEDLIEAVKNGSATVQ